MAPEIQNFPSPSLVLSFECAQSLPSQATGFELPVRPLSVYLGLSHKMHLNDQAVVHTCVPPQKG